MRFKIKALLLAVFFLFLTVGGVLAIEYTITIENLTGSGENPDAGMYLKNLIIAAHGDDVDFFEPGSLASVRLQWLAECGNADRYFKVEDGDENLLSDTDTGSENLEELGAAFIDPRGNSDYPMLQILGPNDDPVSVTLDVGDNTLLTIMGRIMATNDGLVGLDAGELPTGVGAPAIFDLYAWDVGTESNNERLKLPAFCGINCSAEEIGLLNCTEQPCTDNFTALGKCNREECQGDSYQILDCYKEKCVEKITEYGECYGENFSSCEQDQEKETPDYVSLDDCIDKKCSIETSDLENCLEAGEGEEENACEGLSSNFLKCSAGNCRENYADIDVCLSDECSEVIFTYVECLDTYLQCEEDIKNNSCDIADPDMPDLPGLKWLPENTAIGVALGERTDKVHIHRGVLGDLDPDGGKSDLDSNLHRWNGPVAKVVVTVN